MPSAAPIPDRSIADAPASGPTPLAPVLGLAAINSVATSALTSGVYFLTEHAYGFSRLENYGLALLQGVLYIAGALLAGRVLRSLHGWRIPTRTVLGLVLLVLAGAAVMPALTRQLGIGGPWAAWTFMAVYSPATGMLWPVVESYVSGGRRGAGLRRAIGRFNVVWAGSLVFMAVAMGAALGPEHPEHAVAAFGVVAVLHGVSIFVLPSFAPEPGHHDDDDEPHPPEYVRLLAGFRVLLPMSYLVLSTLGPSLPEIMKQIGVRKEWSAPLTAVWHLSRVLAFAAMERWHAWHGRWWTAWVGVSLLVGGFGATMLTPRLLEGAPALASVLLGLSSFGVGMAMVYTAALYYAMSVHTKGVHAGGTHEALIGLGYTAGPGFGLGAAGAVGAGLLGEAAFEWVVVGLVMVSAGGAVALAVRSARR